MNQMFLLTEDGRARLKTFSGTTRAGKHILKVEVEYAGAVDMAYDLESLANIQEAQKPARATRAKPSSRPAKKQIGTTETLALPAPVSD